LKNNDESSLPGSQHIVEALLGGAREREKIRDPKVFLGQEVMNPGQARVGSQTFNEKVIHPEK
jgi:hypothetical protein